MTQTPVATSVQLARAEALGKALTRYGWTSCREPQDEHPGAVAATAYTRLGVRALVLTLGGRRGQMIEVTAESSCGYRREASRRARGLETFWRLTAYDPPTEAILAAAIAPFDGLPAGNPLDLAGWTIERALAHKLGSSAMSYTYTYTYTAKAAVPLGAKFCATRFTRPDGVVTATFHIPTYIPPCEHCPGDTGGWIITGPGFVAETTAHIPVAVIGAFIRALPGDRPNQPATTSEAPPVKPQRPTRSIPASAGAPGGRLTVTC
jgi:hypothetical protein